MTNENTDRPRQNSQADIQPERQADIRTEKLTDIEADKKIA